MGQIVCKRVYDHTASDGCRILVDRLWPRGIKKEDACINRWAKEAAPSNDLRKWFAHVPARYEEFSEQYRRELEENPAAEELAAYCVEQIRQQDIILLYAAKDPEMNNAVVLRDWLHDKLEAI